MFLLMLDKLALHNPSTEYKDTFISALKALDYAPDKRDWVYLGANADTNIPIQDFNTYVQTLLKYEMVPPLGFVCNTVWWAFYEDEMVGRISFRHELNNDLKISGGHIGYIVHPKWRGKGIATWMLGEVLKIEKVKEVGKVLLTCDDGNVASEKSIIKNGGVFEKSVSLGESNPLKKHFWIDVK